MRRLRDRAKKNKFGWALYVTIYSIGLFLGAGVFLGLLVAPLYLVQGESSSYEVVGIVAFPLVLVGFTVLATKIFSHRTGDSVASVLGLKRPKRKTVWLLPLTILVYLFLLVLVMSVLAILSPDLANQEQDIVEMVDALGGWQLVLTVVGVGFLTPIAEEFLFRGFMLWAYSEKLKIWVSIILTSVLFGIAHGQVNVGLDTFIFGVALGLLRWQTASVYPPVFMHMLKNSLALTVILS